MENTVLDSLTKREPPNLTEDPNNKNTTGAKFAQGLKEEVILGMQWLRP